MKLRIHTDLPLTNLEVIRRVLSECKVPGAVDFNDGTGAGSLSWSKDGGRHSVRVAIPIRWLIDLDKAEVLERCARHFLESIRAGAGGPSVRTARRVHSPSLRPRRRPLSS